MRNKSFKIFDVDVVKEDLLNHIFTRFGERVKMASFGSIIPTITFEPLDDETVFRVQEDIQAVLDYDPRVEIIELKVIPVYEENALVILADVRYVEIGLAERLDIRIEFER